jgi:hypothetical protein
MAHDDGWGTWGEGGVFMKYDGDSVREGFREPKQQKYGEI